MEPDEILIGCFFVLMAALVLLIAVWIIGESVITSTDEIQGTVTDLLYTPGSSGVGVATGGGVAITSTHESYYVLVDTEQGRLKVKAREKQWMELVPGMHITVLAKHKLLGETTYEVKS